MRPNGRGPNSSSSTKNLNNRLQERDDLLAKSNEAELGLRKKVRELTDAAEQSVLAQSRREDELRERLDAEAEERYSSQLRAKDEHLQRTRREVEELRRKAATGHAQDEGVAQQGDPRRGLTEPLPVRSCGGHSPWPERGRCSAYRSQWREYSRWQDPLGSQIDRHWSNDWLAKLKADQQKDGAQIGVIASAALPRRTDPVSLTDGYGCAISITPCHWPSPCVRSWSKSLDTRLLMPPALMSPAGSSAGGWQPSFFQHVSSMCDTVTAQRIDSTKIQKAMQQFLKAEETRLTSLENELASMVGELLGLGATICDSVRFDHVATSTGVTKPRAVLVRVPRTALRRVPAQRRVQPSA